MRQVSYQLLLWKFVSFVEKAKFFTETINLLLLYCFQQNTKAEVTLYDKYEHGSCISVSHEQMNQMLAPGSIPFTEKVIGQMHMARAFTSPSVHSIGSASMVCAKNQKSQNSLLAFTCVLQLFLLIAPSFFTAVKREKNGSNSSLQ